MGKRGFTTQPAEVAKAKGLYRPSRHGGLTENLKTEYLSAIPDPPSNLNKEGSEFWIDMLTQLLKIKGLIAIIDLPNFELMAYKFQVIRECQGKLKNGKLIKNKFGEDVESPYVSIMERAEKIFIQLSREFGCTPSARNNLKVEKETEKEESLSDFKI